MAIKIGTKDAKTPYKKIMLGNTEVWKAKTSLDFDDFVKYSYQLMNDDTAPSIIKANALHVYNARDKIRPYFENYTSIMASRQNTRTSSIRIMGTNTDFSTRNMTFYSDSIYTGNIPYYIVEISVNTDDVVGNPWSTNEGSFYSYNYGFLGTMTPEQVAKCGDQCYAQNKYLG